MNEQISLEQGGDWSPEQEEILDRIRKRLQEISAENSSVCKFIIDKKKNELQSKYNDCESYDTWHVLVGSTADKQNNFDFAGDDSIGEWAEEIEINDRVKAIAEVHFNWESISEKIKQLEEHFKGNLRERMWDQYSGELNNNLDEISQGVEKLMDMAEGEEFNSLVEELNKKISKLNESYQGLKQYL